MNDEAVYEIIRKVKEEFSEQLTSLHHQQQEQLHQQQEHFRQQLHQQQEQLHQQQEQINDITAHYKQLADPRLAYFTSDEPSSVGSKRNNDPAIIDNKRKQKNIALGHGSCMGCGITIPTMLSCAHIVANTGKQSDYDCWNMASTIANYNSDIDPYSSANLLVLCGSKGEPGTCHDAYDRHIISLYYNDAGDDYVWWVRHPEFRNRNGDDIHDRHVAIDDPKYSRLLAWRTLAALAMPGPSRVLTVVERVALVDKLLESEAGEQL